MRKWNLRKVEQLYICYRGGKSEKEIPNRVVLFPRLGFLWLPSVWEACVYFKSSSTFTMTLSSEHWATDWSICTLLSPSGNKDSICRVIVLSHHQQKWPGVGGDKILSRFAELLLARKILEWPKFHSYCSMLREQSKENRSVFQLRKWRNEAMLS